MSPLRYRSVSRTVAVSSRNTRIAGRSGKTSATVIPYWLGSHHMQWSKHVDPTWLASMGTIIFAAIPATISALINLRLAAINSIHNAQTKFWGTHASIEHLPWRDLLGTTMFSVVVLAVWALIFWKGGLEIH